MFYFNHEMYDFWPVYDSIKKYYPVGIPKDDTGMYMNYPGLKNLEKVIIDNIHDENNFTNCWESFEKTVEYRTHKIVYGTTYGQTPCFSSYIELDQRSTDNLIRIKEVHFFVSLVGPFYTVLGHDRSEIHLEDDKIYATNFLTISPEYEYQESFELICQSIEERFPGFRFIPHGIYSQQIEGLDVHYTGEKLNTIFNALFNNQINLQARTIGKGYFKSEHWLVEGYDLDSDNKWASTIKK
jgi:hypothetical protein